MRATIEVHHFFSEAFPIWELETYLSQKLMRRKLHVLPDEKSNGLGTERESGNTNSLSTYFRRFGVKERRHSETINFRRKVPMPPSYHASVVAKPCLTFGRQRPFLLGIQGTMLQNRLDIPTHVVLYIVGEPSNIFSQQA